MRGRERSLVHQVLLPAAAKRTDTIATSKRERRSDRKGQRPWSPPLLPGERPRAAVDDRRWQIRAVPAHGLSASRTSGRRRGATRSFPALPGRWAPRIGARRRARKRRAPPYWPRSWPRPRRGSPRDMAPSRMRRPRAFRHVARIRAKRQPTPHSHPRSGSTATRRTASARRPTRRRSHRGNDRKGQGIAHRQSHHTPPGGPRFPLLSPSWPGERRETCIAAALSPRRSSARGLYRRGTE
jgi:hypothetical protein